MAADAKLKVWIGKDNIQELVVIEDGIALTDLSAFTRVLFCIGGVIVDSDDTVEVIWWNGTVTDKEVPGYGSFTGNVVRARLGRELDEAGEYTDCSLVMYSPAYPLGWVASDSITVTVEEFCEA